MNTSTNANPYKLSFNTKETLRSSGLISPATQSTSVTPITPMTPLTTPRTPAQILLGRNELRAAKQQRGLGAASSMEPYEERQQQQLALEMFTNFVDSIESALMEIRERECEGERVIGPGIVRMCRDLAERVEEVAEEWKEVKGEVYDLVLSEHDGEEELVHEALSVENVEGCDISSGMIYEILTDAAESLRSITPQEAEELAEVSLQVAIMAVWTLRTVQRNMSRMLNSSEVNLNQVGSRGIDMQTTSRGIVIQQEEQVIDEEAVSASRTQRVTWSKNDDTTIISSDDDNTVVASNGHRSRGLGPLVEISGEDEKKDDHININNINGAEVVSAFDNGMKTPPKEFPPKYSPRLATIPSSPSDSPSSSPPTIQNTDPARCRAIWPPLLPALQQATQTCINSAQEHPLPAAAIGLVCGPAAITTAVIMGPPVLITDWAVQSSYNAMADTPFIENVEKAAANAFQVTRLAMLCSKLAIKQGVAVGERQIQRHGGIAKICSDVVDGAVDRVMHPVETVGMAWDGLFWMGGVVRDAVGFVGDVVGGGERMDMH